jgi:hypothetical protein
MKAEQAIVIGIVLVGVAFAAYWEAKHRMKKNTEITPEMLSIGLDRPCIWVYYDNSQVNSRDWADFGARSSRAINIPMLNLFYETIVKANGDMYRVEVIGGLQRVTELLGKDAMPSSLRNLNANVGVAQEDWIRAAILAKYGGLWLNSSVVCVKGFGGLPDKVTAFGQDDKSMYGTSVPGFRALWSPKPNHPLFVEWEERTHARLDSMLGGLQVRGDAKSDWYDLIKWNDVEHRPFDELSRDPTTHKKLDLEHLFAKGKPLDIPQCVKYIVVPYDDLTSRTMYSWLLRNSEEQILESDMAISAVLRKMLA